MIKTILIIACILSSLSFSAQTIERFSEGERVVFLGNSITDGGRYHSYVWLYYMTRFPNLRIQMFNSGISADNVLKMQKRFETDVMPHKPTYLFLTFGMNDSGYEEYNKPGAKEFGEQKYLETVQNFIPMETKIKSLNNTKVAVISPSPYEEVADFPQNPVENAHKGKTDVMLRITDFQKEKSKENNWGFVDLIHPMLAINQEGQKSNPAFTISGEDRVHPYNMGHMVMAYLILKAQDFSGEKVASINIDAKKNEVLIAENCKISNVTNQGGTLSFNYLANSLPYPIDTVHIWGSASQYDALQHIPFMSEMNDERLAVQGLNDGNYKLAIDGEVIREITAQELSKGINLAEYSHTPQYQQAMSVMHLNEERWEIERRIRQYKGLQYRYLEEKGLLFEDSRKTLDQLQSELDTHYMLPHLYPNYTKARFEEIRKTWDMMQQLLIDRIYTINKPIERIITITKI